MFFFLRFRIIFIQIKCSFKKCTLHISAFVYLKNIKPCIDYTNFVIWESYFRYFSPRPLFSLRQSKTSCQNTGNSKKALTVSKIQQACPVPCLHPLPSLAVSGMVMLGRAGGQEWDLWHFGVVSVQIISHLELGALGSSGPEACGY